MHSIFYKQWVWSDNNLEYEFNQRLISIVTKRFYYFLFDKDLNLHHRIAKDGHKTPHLLYKTNIYKFHKIDIVKITTTQVIEGSSYREGSGFQIESSYQLYIMSPAAIAHSCGADWSFTPYKPRERRCQCPFDVSLQSARE